MGLSQCLSTSEVDHLVRTRNAAWKEIIKRFPKWNWISSEGGNDVPVREILSVSTSTQITLTKLQDIEKEKATKRKEKTTKRKVNLPS